MDFRWKGQGDREESPGQDGDGFGGGSRGRAGGGAGGMFSFAGASDRGSDLDDEDNDPVYSLFKNGAANSFGGMEPQASGSSSVLGLTSLDFWDMEDVKPSLGGTGPGAAGTIKREDSNDGHSLFQDNDPVLGARRDMMSHPSPTGLTPDGPASFGTFGGTPYGSANSTNAFASPGAPPLNAGSQSQPYPGLHSGSMDTSTLFGFHSTQPASVPSSAYASPASSAGGIALHDLLAVHPLAATSGGPDMQGLFVNPQLASGYAASDHSSPASPPVLSTVQQSSGSDQTTSQSSRDSSSNPENRDARMEPPRNYTDKTPSSTSTTRTTTAKNSPPGPAKELTHPTRIDNFAFPAAQGPSGAAASGSQMPDKVSQQQASESASVVRGICREDTSKLINGACQLLVLGLPDEGARSRVETQVKVGLVLLKPKPSKPRNGRGREGTPHHAMSFKEPKGSLMPEADEHFERVGSWRYLCLPTVSSVKRNAKKHHKSGIPPEETLYVDVKVVSATNPSKEISICPNCRQRELKRTQRKTQNRSKPVQEIESGAEDEKGYSEAELAKKKIVLFNCGQYLDFNTGEAVIPTRITCYCRHHKEKYGFNIVYSVTDHLNNTIASAMSPAIFLTDDHKARPTKPDSSFDLKNMPALAAVANGPHSRPNSAWNSAASSMPSSVPVSAGGSQASSAASSARPSRSNSVENLEELESHAKATRSVRNRSGQPYQLPESRSGKPKRNASINRLNSFAMTPLNLSRPGSPRHNQSPLMGLTTLPTELPPQAQESLQSFNDFLNQSAFTGAVDTHPSPNSSLSAPSTPGQGYESLNGFNTGRSLGPGSTTSNDDLASLGRRSVDQSPAYGSYAPLPGQSVPQFAGLAQVLSAANVEPTAIQQGPQPRIGRLIPNEGPVQGGIEVIMLGENFTQGLEVTFGDAPAVGSQLWGSNTLVCILPPSPSPGPVVVGFKGIPMALGNTSGLQLFTYQDTSDKALMELALQVVGMKMTGRIDDARNVARRIIGGQENQSSGGQGTTPSPQLSSQTGPFMQAALGGPMSKSTAALQEQLMQMGACSRTGDFQAIVIKLLSLLDVDYSEMDDQINLATNPINHRNDQHHTLLHLSALLGFHRLASFLIERDADLDAVDKNGYTPTHLAALCGRVTVARLLVEAGAATYIRNLAGQTAQDIAVERDEPDVIAVLTARSRAGSSASLKLPRGSVNATPILGSPAHSPTSRHRRMFSLGVDESDADDHATDSDPGTSSDSDSSWSDGEDDEAHFNSGSDLESRLSRHASSASISAWRGRPAQTVRAQLDSDDETTLVDDELMPNDVKYAGPDSSDKGVGLLGRWRSLASLSKLQLPSPPSLASWRHSAPMTRSASRAFPRSGLQTPDSQERGSLGPATQPSERASPGRVTTTVSTMSSSLCELPRCKHTAPLTEGTRPTPRIFNRQPN